MFIYMKTCIQVFSRYQIGVLIMETRQMVIDDLRRLGVKVNQILIHNPSYEQLKGMRDGLTRLRN